MRSQMPGLPKRICQIGPVDPQKWELIEYLKTDDPLISGSGIPIPPVDTKTSGPLQPCEQQDVYVAGCDLNPVKGR